VNDYKMDIQEAAEELAWQKYEMNFYDLSSEQQDELYWEAEERFWESR